jgi:gas vesicle protein
VSQTFPAAGAGAGAFAGAGAGAFAGAFAGMVFAAAKTQKRRIKANTYFIILEFSTEQFLEA